jgi:hypothetical protein
MMGKQAQMVLEEEWEANEDVNSLSDSRLIKLMDPARKAECKQAHCILCIACSCAHVHAMAHI